MRILDRIRAIKKKKQFEEKKRFMALAEDSYYGPSFRVDLRHPKEGEVYLTVGSNCLIEGTFVFETESGHISVGDRCHIGNGMMISRTSIKIGNDVTIAWGHTVYDHNSHAVDWEDRKHDTLQEYEDICRFGDAIRNKDWSKVKTKPIVIEDKAWIGMNVTVLKGVTIGEGAVVGAGSVVTHDVPPWTVVAGNPARIVKNLEKH